MTATQTNTDSSKARRRAAPVARGAFTLTELLVVIALIVLLVGLLLAALGQVQEKAKETRTLATIQAFRNACDAFQQEHGFYPGIVPEDVMVEDARVNNGVPTISGTENALLHLMGGFARAVDFADINEYNNLSPADGWGEITFTGPNGSYPVKVNTGLLGEGPVIGGKPYASYFTPGRSELGIAQGQPPVPGTNPSGPGDWHLPDLLDAWGQPIIYLRRQRTIGPITSINVVTNPNPQFDPAAIRPYTLSSALGKLAGNQNADSILTVAPDAFSTLGKILGHPALSKWGGAGSGIVTGQARGAYMLLSAGPDGIYFSQYDGPGNPNQPVADILALPSSVIEEYDDVLIFGGD